MSACEPKDLLLARKLGLHTWEQVEEYLRTVVPRGGDGTDDDVVSPVRWCCALHHLMAQCALQVKGEEQRGLRENSVLVRMFYLASVRLSLLVNGRKNTSIHKRFFQRTFPLMTWGMLVAMWQAEPHTDSFSCMLVWLWEMTYKFTKYQQPQQLSRAWFTRQAADLISRLPMPEYQPVFLSKLKKMMLRCPEDLWLIQENTFKVMPAGMVADLADKVALANPRVPDGHPLLKNICEARVARARWSHVRAAWVSSVARSSVAGDAITEAQAKAQLAALDTALSTRVSGSNLLHLIEVMCSIAHRLEQCAGKRRRKVFIVKYCAWWTVLPEAAKALSAGQELGPWRWKLWKYVKYLMRCKRHCAPQVLDTMFELLPLFMNVEGLAIPSVSRWMSPYVWAVGPSHALHGFMLGCLQACHRKNPFEKKIVMDY